MQWRNIPFGYPATGGTPASPPKRLVEIETPANAIAMWGVESAALGKSKNIKLIPDPASPDNRVIPIINNLTDPPPTNERTEMTSKHGAIK